MVKKHSVRAVVLRKLNMSKSMKVVAPGNAITVDMKAQ